MSHATLCFRSFPGRRRLQKALSLHVLRAQLQEQELAESPRAVRVRQGETVLLSDLPKKVDPEEQSAQAHARRSRDLTAIKRDGENVYSLYIYTHERVFFVMFFSFIRQVQFK